MAKEITDRYKELNIVQVQQLAEAGWTEQEIADFFKLKLREWNFIMLTHTLFAKNFNNWVAFSTKRVEKSLYNRCLDRTLVEEKINFDKDRGKYVTKESVKTLFADQRAIEFFLTNKDPSNWKNRSETKNEITGGISVADSDLKERIEKKKDSKLDEFFK